MKGKKNNVAKYVSLMIMVLMLSVSMTTSAASRPTLKYSKSTIKAGSTMKISVKNISKKVKWSTSNKKIATVKSSGKTAAKITAKKPGTVKIKAKQVAGSWKQI